MNKVFKFFTALCGLGILVLGSCLDSTDHFGAILGGLIFCTAECLIAGYILQKGEDL